MYKCNKMTRPRLGQISIITEMSGHSWDQLPNYNRPLLLIEGIVNIFAFLMGGGGIDNFLA